MKDELISHHTVKSDIRIETNYNKDSKFNEPRDLTPAEYKKVARLLLEENKIRIFHHNLEKQEELFLNAMDKDFEIFEQPREMTTKLLDFQLYGISWMMNRERSEIRGGILADEMGMGKTLQALGLILNGNKGELTLVIVPAVAMNQWIEEMELHAPNAFHVRQYHGRERFKSFEVKSTKYNVILTTYGTLSSEYRRKTGFILPQVYKRIILDEAHYVKHKGTLINSAITMLKGSYRWGLTGTPVQNRVADLYSLVRFLRVDPHSFYYCKKCPCKSYRWLNYDKNLWHSEDEIKKMSDPAEIDKNIKINNASGSTIILPKEKPIITFTEELTRRRGFCVCGHFGASHFGWWNRRIVTPVRNFGFTIKGKQIFNDLQKITSHFILRRTKNMHEDQLGLPPKKIRILSNYFTEQEKDFYTSLYKNTRTEYDSYVAKGQVNNSYMHIFSLINKLRLAANHPYLAIKNYNSEFPICGFCNDEADDPILGACKHVFCREEARNFLLTDSKCPVCKIKMTIDLNQEYNFTVKNRIIHTNDWTSSSKIESLVENLYQMKSEFESPKSLVFSQFVDFLELLRWRLERAGFKCLKIYGSSSMAQRREAIEQFNKDKKITVFLISLKAGGVALNLTEANHVFLMDLWWNQAVENQAIDRIHRIGQYRPIEVTKIIVQDSIESKILALQEKKQVLFESAVDNNQESLEKLSEDDLAFLFS